MIESAVVCVGNMKGGVGKTTLSILLSRFLALREYNVLLIDADPQASASQHLLDEELIDENGMIRKGLHRILDTMLREGGRISREEVENQLHHVVGGGMNEAYWLLPNFLTSSYYDSYLVTNSLHLTLFRKILEALSEYRFDVVIIDSPPYINAFSISAITVCNSLVIPVEAAPVSVVSAKLMLETIGKYVSDGLISTEILRKILVVPTKVRRTTASSASLRQILSFYKDYAIHTYMPFTDIVYKLYAGVITVARIIESRKGAAARIGDLLDELEVEAVAPFLPERTLKRFVEEEKNE